MKKLLFLLSLMLSQKTFLEASFWQSATSTLSSGFNAVASTVKSNLGFAQPEQFASIAQQAGHATRLTAYTLAAAVALTLCMTAIKSDSMDTNITPIYQEKPSFVYGALIAPIAKELLFTYLPFACFGSKAQYVIPFIFGALHWQDHYRNSPLLGLHRICITGLGSFLRLRTLSSNPQYIFSPLFMHMLTNTIGLSLMP